MVRALLSAVARRRLLVVLAVLMAGGIFSSPGHAQVLFSPCPFQSHPSVSACNLTVTGNQATATFTIASGFSNVEIRLGSYVKPPPANVATFPQFLFAGVGGNFSTGTHRLRVALPSCGFWQVDLVRGFLYQTLIGPQDSIEGRVLGYALGESGRCVAQTRTIGFWKNHASCSASRGNQAFVLDQTLALAGGSILIGDLLVDTCLEAVRILNKSTINTDEKRASHPAYNLAAQLLGVRLNIVAGTRSCPAVISAVAAAQNLLDTVNFTGSNSPAMTSAQRTQANGLATTLDTYNNGGLC